MGKFNYFKSDFVLRRDDILFRFIHNDERFISNLLLYRTRQELIEDRFNIFFRKKYRRKSFKWINLTYKRNLRRKKTKKDILDWLYRRVPLT
jgi:hypothetical protein